MLINDTHQLQRDSYGFEIMDLVIFWDIISISAKVTLTIKSLASFLCTSPPTPKHKEKTLSGNWLPDGSLS